MALPPFILAVFLYCSGVSSQSAWTQPASESVTLRKTVKLSCTTRETGGNYIHWYQQKPGKAPRYVHCESCSRGEGIPDRFTASRSGTMGYLTITNVQDEDEADYYCGRWYNSANAFHGDTN